MQHVSQGKAFPRFYQRVNVIRHDTPGQKTIALYIEIKQRTLHQARNIRLTQPTSAMTRLEVFFDATAKFNSALTFGLKCQFGFPFFDNTCGHRITETKIHGLDHARMIPMRQVAARIPAMMRLGWLGIGHHTGGLFCGERKTWSERRMSFLLRVHARNANEISNHEQVRERPPGSAGVPPACFKNEATHQLAGGTPALPGTPHFISSSPSRGGNSNVTLPLSSMTR
jgi:hypothetical protein